MRYWQICYPDENGKDMVEVLSDDNIIDQYWKHWYSKMIDEFGKKHVDEYYCKLDCISDWVTVHWAIEVNDEN